LARLRDDDPVLGGRRDRDATPSSEFEQPLVAQLPERAQDGVPVHVELGRQVTGRRQALAGLRLPLGDRAPDLGGHLLVQVGRLCAIDIDTEHGASDNSFTVDVVTRPSPPRSEEDLDAEALEALIEEARRRARRRRRGYVAAALAAIAAGLLGFYAVDNDGDSDGGNRSSDRGEPRERGAGVTDGRWRIAPGLEGGTITALAVDPRHPDTVFAATLEAGVFGSANGGRTWQPLDLGPDVNRVDALAIAPGDPETIYAGTGRGVVKSTDGGASWRAAGLRGAPAINREPSSDEEVARFMEQSAHRAIEGYISTLVVDPRDPDVAYAGTWENGAFRTENGGRSWQHIGSSEGVSALALHRRVIYAGGEERGVVKSTDGGASWQPAGLRGTPVNALALDPKRPQTIYAGSLAGGIFKTTDGGATWRRTGRAGDTISGLSVDPHNPDVVYAATWTKGVYRTGDGGRTWRLLDAGASSSAVALDPRSPRTIYVGTGNNVDDGAGVAKSVDGGRSWRPMNVGLTAARVPALAVAPGGAVYAAVLGRGVFKRVDGSWRPTSAGLTSKIVQSVAADSRDPANVYVGTDVGIFKSTNGGTSWHAAFFTEPLWRMPAVHLAALAVDPQNPTTVYAIAMNDQMAVGGGFARVYDSLALKSTNGGRTWPMVARARTVKVKAPNETRLRALSVATQDVQHRSPLAIDPNNPEVLYVGGPGVTKSSDGGTTWRASGLGRKPVLGLAVDPSQTRTLYAGTDTGVFKSSNAGATWQPLHGALDGVRVETLAVDPKDHRTVFAGTDRGVHWSTDGGLRWHRFTRLPRRPFRALVVDRSTGVLYAGAFGGGVYELTLAR
jgi:photosystem II stability/assembly factor-like uncharacterized protein